MGAYSEAALPLSGSHMPITISESVMPVVSGFRRRRRCCTAGTRWRRQG